MKRKVEVTMMFTVPEWYRFDDVAGVVSKITEAARQIQPAEDADTVSVVVDEDDEE